MQRRQKNQGGFSLIELMLALTLGLVVTAGIVQLFVGNNRTTDLITGQSRLQESARYALDFISRSARSSGFYGCAPDADKIGNTLNADWPQLFELNMPVPIEGFDGTGTGNSLSDWTPGLDSLPRNTGGTSVNTIISGNGVTIADLVPQSDILVLRYMVAPGHRITQQINPGADPIVENAGNLPFAANDYGVISNCEQATVFQITGLTTAAGETTLARGSAVGIYANTAGASLSEGGLAFGNAADNQGTVVAELITDIYFVAEGAGTNNRGDTNLALWRKRGTRAPVELVEGISDMQILFGVDTTPNNIARNANRYVPFAGVGTNPVRSVRISIEANTVDVVSDSAVPISRTFTQTVSLRNSG